jgi:AcrR family transcriptional regulator
MASLAPTPSARKEELLEAAYRYTLEHGLAEMSLRPLASAIGSSPRVLIFLFGSKDGLIRALLARARADELSLLEQANHERPGLSSAVRTTWEWLVADAHRPLLTLWLEAYARSLTEPLGPWSGFARQTVDDWLAVLPGAERALALAVMRGALLDLLATRDVARTTAAVDRFITLLGPD